MEREEEDALRAAMADPAPVDPEEQAQMKEVIGFLVASKAQ